MGELSKNDAERKREQYQDQLNKMKSKVRENFEEMDFENADQRNFMENHVEAIESVFNGLIMELGAITFE